MTYLVNLKMVGYDSKSSNLTSKDVAIAGALSGCITRGLLQPIDVLKIRFQLQVEPISHHSVSKYRSVPQGFYTIVREEGIKALWKGHVPAQYLSITYGLVQFWVYETSRKKIAEISENNLMSDFLCGSFAGSVATLISFPFDISRTRLVAQSENLRIYKGMVHTISTIVKTEGPLSLYTGLLPALLQIAPHAGVQFMTFKLFERFYRKYISFEQNRTDIFSSGLICGSLSGLCAKTAVYPFDLARKRLQIQGFDRKIFGQNFICNGLLDCVRQTYRFEGLVGLFKGLYPSLIKAVLTGAMHFTTYDLICYEIARFRKL